MCCIYYIHLILKFTSVAIIVPSMKIEKGNLKDFFNVPFNVYSKQSGYVSPFWADIKRFISTQNPLFESEEDFEIFTVKDEKKAIGRLIVHHHAASNKQLNEKKAYIGYFDCCEDYEVARLLLSAALGWAKEKGFNELFANFNLTAMQQMGVVTSGFENAPYIEQIYNEAHIAEYLEKFGFTKSFPMTTFELDLEKIDIQKGYLGPKQQELIADKDYEFRNVKKKEQKKQLKEIHKLLNDGFSDNPMFIPLTEEEFMFQSKDMMMIMDEKISFIAYHKNVAVATVVIIPDLNPFLKSVRSRFSWKLPFEFFRFKFFNKRAVLIFSSVSGEYQNKGLMGVLLMRAFRIS